MAARPGPRSTPCARSLNKGRAHRSPASFNANSRHAKDYRAAQPSWTQARQRARRSRANPILLTDRAPSRCAPECVPNRTCAVPRGPQNGHAVAPAFVSINYTTSTCGDGPWETCPRSRRNAHRTPIISPMIISIKPGRGGGPQRENSSMRETAQRCWSKATVREAQPRHCSAAGWPA